ncbi:beta-glucosidase family protein [Rhodanobacter denitrificans]|uniref:Beta-glucosidase-like glycosyl hydrolase n=1 Tax=Rhodanobacter denitrificans TaxID=666685 RepID=M4NAA3_9GAMM|nr:glycoside hydrolase family 3 C-terminal domain-containing protein [Rhodanobacter denitrificans]AGG87354.1 beta-glucosidase-like glycosyl hydrolase [Rhodanobacter denitrificans]UJJ51267.1 glycoside hydrolase family 3 C-terminal domain-containing protein [Rhodanobacter denitrificans]UJM86537.1 glycoside hydrolase family 3 C-terminal domain-containing protein [Rhodanobacter denitrificans]
MSRRPRRLSACAFALAVVATATAAGEPPARPWMNTSLSPDARAALVVQAMSQDEKFQLITTAYGSASDGKPAPACALGSAACAPALSRLGLPALQETDAGLGVARPLNAHSRDVATALPSGLATAASWDPAVAEAGGAMIGREAHRKGFNVLLAGGVNLLRDPRNGRNFEYAGEDPLLAGVMAGHAVRGIQSQHVVSTLKHYAVNDLETGRNTMNAKLDRVAARESDLRAFEIALGIGAPGSVMCAYNRVNGTYACENAWLLDQVLKRDWGYQGFVMSDWGAVHSAAKSALAGLDQESAGETFDPQVFFAAPLREAIAKGEVPQARLDDMVRRILRSLFAVGAIDHPAKAAPIDYAADAKVSQHAAEAGAVLLRNQDNLLPLARTLASVAVIGAHADRGVLAGGGSSAVTAQGGNAVPGLAPTVWPGPVMYHPSAPLAAIARRVGGKASYASGEDIAAAAKLAASSAVAVVFVQQWAAESFDRPSMALNGHQDALVAAVAKANPRTVVVLENNGPVAMPWLAQTAAVLEAWYPGNAGGEAIARLLFGEVAPSGRLPLSWPRDASQLPRPAIAGAGLAAIGLPPQGQPADTVDYDIEGADVGYRWFQRRGSEPLFPFGYGLGYTTFGYGPLTVTTDAAGAVTASFAVTNTGSRAGADVPQLYVQLPGEQVSRLVGWQKLALRPGETKRVRLALPAVRFARYDDRGHGWRVAAGTYRLLLGRSSAQIEQRAELRLPAVFPAGAQR